MLGRRAGEALAPQQAERLPSDAGAQESRTAGHEEERSGVTEKGEGLWEGVPRMTSVDFQSGGGRVLTTPSH